MAEEQVELNWDDEQKGEVITYIRTLGDKTRDYFASAIQYANEQKKETPEEFWRKLFYERKTPYREPIQKEKGDYQKQQKVRRKEITPEEAGVLLQDVCPADPYHELDFQALCKFLKYGDDRKFPDGEEDDSKNFYNVFQFNDRLVPEKDYKCDRPNARKYGNNQRVYKKQLSRAFDLRNGKMAHTSTGTMKRITWDALEDAVATFEFLTAQMQRTEGWMPEGMLPLKDFWKKIRAEITKKFGSAPLSLLNLGQEVFETTEDLSPRQQELLEEISDSLNLDCRNGMVYQQPNRAKLLSIMRGMYELLLRGEAASAETAVAAQEEQERQAQEQQEAMRQAEEREAQLTAPLWNPVSQKQAAVLRRAGTMLSLTQEVWGALLDSFQILMDETLFLADEGQSLLQKLLPVLAARHVQLPLDASVVSAIFRQFRSTVPYTDLELEEMEPERRTEMQALRRKMHQEAKNGIKVLRGLREKNCLKVISSPTDSREPYENIAWLARMNPQARILVLTLDRQLAEELAQLKSHNAVAAKPDLDGGLFFFRTTRETYTDMLRPPQQEQPVPVPPAAGTQAGKSSEPKAERDVVLPVRRVPISGEMMTAEFADGTVENLRLGEFLNSGGEGSIYLTSREKMVAKLYLPKHLTQGRLEKLRHMIAADPHMEGLCWPCALLHNSLGEWIGFLMPRAQGKELATTVLSPGRGGGRNIKDMGWSRRHLVTVAGNIAGLFAEMHQWGVLMGDVNPRNFMVAPDCTVYFVDCDSYQFDGFACPVFSPLFLSPEIHERMRATAGSGASSFPRTREDECYSIAVLLFEILLLGKAPYESRNSNNDDVVQAIIDGNFPYPYRSDDEDKEDLRRSPITAPLGIWRKIWSHMPYMVKTGFYETFTRKKGANRPSAAEWARIMRSYREMIEEGKSSDELQPTTYKELTDREGAVMVHKVCQQCGKPFNMGEEVFRRRHQRGEAVLCDTCRDQQRNYEKRKRMVRCDHCGRTFQSNMAAWLAHEEKGKHLYCPGCVNEMVTCARCGKLYAERREKVERLRGAGKALLCSDCFQAMFTQAVCSECGETYWDRTEMVESHQRAGRPLLCPKCRKRVSTT